MVAGQLPMLLLVHDPPEEFGCSRISPDRDPSTKEAGESGHLGDRIKSSWVARYPCSIMCTAGAKEGNVQGRGGGTGKRKKRTSSQRNCAVAYQGGGGLVARLLGCQD